jgi:hypothetical protein
MIWRSVSSGSESQLELGPKRKDLGEKESLRVMECVDGL